MKTKTKKYCKCGCGCGKKVYLDKRHFTCNGVPYICNHQRRGIKLSAQACKNMSEGRKGMTLSEEHKKNLSKAHKGIKCHQSEKEQKRLSAWAKGLWDDPVYCAKMIKLNGEQKHTKATKKKMSKSRLALKERQGYLVSSETRKKLSKMSKKRWEDPEYKERVIKATLKAVTTFPNKSEKKLRRILNKLFPGEYKYVGDGSVLIGHKSPDFINVNGQKKLIEMFGDYWHSKERTGLSKKEHRKQRQKHFEQYGYKTLVIWEHQLYDNVAKVKERVKNFHGLQN